MTSTGNPARSDVQIPSGSGILAGWLYNSPRSSTSSPGPALVMGHGLGGLKHMRLNVFAAEFQSLGYTVVVFDYRYHGESPGSPRGLIDYSLQQEDWRAAVSYARGLENVDADRIGLFGTSFSGGHVIQIAAGDDRIKAVPFHRRNKECPVLRYPGPSKIVGAGPEGLDLWIR